MLILKNKNKLRFVMPKIQDLRVKLQIEVIYAFVFNAL